MNFEQLTLKGLETLSNFGFSYGPFFFSIFFMVFVMKRTREWYFEANTRKQPLASDYEKKIHGRTYIASYVTGTTLVFIAVGWWVYAQLQTHTFKGVIEGVNPKTQIYTSQENVYLRISNHSTGLGQMQNYHSVIVEDEPFKHGEYFILNYLPQSGGLNLPKPIELKVIYDGKSDRFRIKELDDHSITLKSTKESIKEPKI